MADKAIKFFNGLFLLMIGGGLITAYMQWLDPITGLLIMIGGLLMGTLSTMLGVWESVRLKSLKPLRRVLISIPATIVALAYVLVRGNSPLINDVTTNLDSPPKYLKNLDPELDLNSTYSADQKQVLRQLYPDLQSVEFTWPCFRVYEETVKLLNSNPTVEIVETTQSPYVIQYTQRTSILKFTDDIVIALNGESKEQCFMDIRSRSRKGKSDLNANYSRIKNLIRLLSMNFEVLAVEKPDK